MNTVEQWAATICLAVLAAALVEYLTPGKQMQPVLRFVLGIFLLYAMVSPLREGLHSWDFSSQSIWTESRLPATVERQVREAVEQNLTASIAEALYASGIRVKNVAVEMDIAEDGGIEINQITVYLPSEEMARGAEIEAELEKTLGLETEVEPYGGGEP